MKNEYFRKKPRRKKKLPREAEKRTLLPPGESSIGLFLGSARTILQTPFRLRVVFSRVGTEDRYFDGWGRRTGRGRTDASAKGVAMDEYILWERVWS